MSHQGEPGHPGSPGEFGTGGGGQGGSGGTGGRGGTALTRSILYSVVFLFLFSLALAAGNFLFTSALVHRADVSRARADANRASITQLCEAGNESRHQQIQLWTFLIAISRPPPHETPAAKAQREKVTRLFLAHIHQVFRPRNCTRE